MSQLTSLQRNEEETLATVRLTGALARQVVSALSDEYSSRILVSTVTKGKTVQEISLEQAIPLSSCYRKADELVEQGLLVVERVIVTMEGKRYAVYRSTFKGVKTTSDFGATTVSAELNADVAEKFRSKWSCLNFNSDRR